MDYKMTQEDAANALTSMYDCDLTVEVDHTSRKRGYGGGRKGLVLENPVPHINEDKIPLWFEDVVVGVIQCYSEKKNTDQRYVNMSNVIRIFNDCDEISSKCIQRELALSKAQTFRYFEVCKTILKFLKIPIDDTDIT